MSVQTEPQERKQKVNFRLSSEEIMHITQLAQKRGFLNPRGGYDESKALREIIQSHRLLGLQTSEEFRPEKCEGCSQYGGINNEGILCIIKKSETDPVRHQITPFAIGKPCSEKPFKTFPDRKTTQQFQTDISLLITTKDSLSDQLERARQKLETLAIMKENLQRERSENQRLRTDLKKIEQPVKDLLEQKVALETDNDFKTRRIEELQTIVETQSPDTLMQKNKEFLDQLEETRQAMKIQESNHSAKIEDLNVEIKKWEALAKTEKDKNIDIRFTLAKAFRDFKQFLPTESRSCEVCSEGGFKLKEYRRSALKTIEDLEGYLETVAR